jgi:hypothetical protein
LAGVVFAKARSLSFQVGMKVDPGGFDLLVAEPERYHRGVDAGVE